MVSPTPSLYDAKIGFGTVTAKSDSVRTLATLFCTPRFCLSTDTHTSRKRDFDAAAGEKCLSMTTLHPDLV